ncbi:hypothetical protein FB45DRAFT_927970 [Roridomyces roridus]|uniref:HMG box domain-containing protein n=1 Tax=Roridomyces roridus TaxID=1738132 RepID=A0AAD7BGW6_9AGAR|nr:hypothetical protein FB45DRAFT_927970 [Roridomyces roridus]
MDDEDYSLYADDAALTSQTLNPDGTPKRPMNAFMIFARRRRPQVSAENQSMRTGDISKILSQEWKAMLPNDKQFYQTQAKQLKETFNAKYPDYVYRRRPNNTRKRRKPDVAARGDTDEAESSPDAEEPPQLPDNSHPRYSHASSDYGYSHARTASYPYPPFENPRGGQYYPSGSAYDAHAGLRKAQSIPAMTMPLSLSPSQHWTPLPASSNGGFFSSSHHSSYGNGGSGGNAYPSAPSPREGPARGSSHSPRYSPYTTSSSLPSSAGYSHSAYSSSSSSASSASPSFSSASPSYAASSSGGGGSGGGGGGFGISAGFGSGYAAPRALVGAGGIGLLDLMDPPTSDGHGSSSSTARGEDYNSYWRADKLL